MLITSKDNVNIKLYQKLVSNKKTRNERNMFVLEGLRICLDAVKENLELYCVFITELAIEKYSEALNFLVENISSEKIFYISNELGDKLSDTKSSQGIFAIMNKLDKNLNADTIISNGKYIVLNNLQDPGNIGTILRTADAVGIDGVIITNDCCDIYNPKVIRSTMGSLFRIKLWDECQIDEVLNAFVEKEITTFAAVIDKNATSLVECDFSKGSAVIIGNEGNGLPINISNKCDKKLTIKMNGNINSLNAAMATGIIMWEMTK